MNKFKILSLSLLLGMSMASCEDILEDNINHDKAHSTSLDQQLPIAVFYAQQTVYDHSEYNIYLSQCLTTTGKSQTGGYPYAQGWEFLNVNRHPQWRRHFFDIGVNVNDIIANSRTSGSLNYEFIARAIRLMSNQLTVDAFGDMPLHPEAGGDAYVSQTPHYETEATVYRWMFEEADYLIENFESFKNAEDNKVIDIRQDRVFEGDLDKWLGLVYATKARLLLRNIPNIDRSSAMCQKIIDCAQNAINLWRKDAKYGDWFGSEPRYKFDGGTGEKSCPWGEANPIINSWESRNNRLTDAVPSKFFVEDVMGVTMPGDEQQQGAYKVGEEGNGYGNDPRLSLLLVPRTGPISAALTGDVVKVRYLENNIGTGATIKQANYPNLYAGAYAKNDGYNPIFTMEELYFIQAEAYYWMGNKSKACELSKVASEQNIRRHLERFLADNGNLYPGGGNVPSTLADAQVADKERFEGSILSFLNDSATTYIQKVGKEYKTMIRTNAVSTIGNKHWFFDPNNYTLSDLMIQKWVSMYMQPEQWTDMRRYHYSNKKNNYGIGDNNEIIYPTLRRPYNLYSAYWVDPFTEAEQEKMWVQRLNYDPQTEDVYNKDEVVRVGAYQDYRWLQKPMIWAQDYGVRKSLTEE